MEAPIELREIPSGTQLNKLSEPSVSPEGHLNSRTFATVDLSSPKKPRASGNDDIVGNAVGAISGVVAFCVAYIFAAIITPIWVGIATASLSSAAITAGIMIGIPVALLLIFQGAVALKERQAMYDEL